MTCLCLLIELLLQLRVRDERTAKLSSLVLVSSRRSEPS